MRLYPVKRGTLAVVSSGADREYPIDLDNTFHNQDSQNTGY